MFTCAHIARSLLKNKKGGVHHLNFQQFLFPNTYYVKDGHDDEEEEEEDEDDEDGNGNNNNINKGK